MAKCVLYGYPVLHQSARLAKGCGFEGANWPRPTRDAATSSPSATGTCRSMSASSPAATSRRPVSTATAVSGACPTAPSGACSTSDRVRQGRGFSDSCCPTLCLPRAKAPGVQGRSPEALVLRLQHPTHHPGLGPFAVRPVLASADRSPPAHSDCESPVRDMLSGHTSGHRHSGRPALATPRRWRKDWTDELRERMGSRD